MAARNCEGLRDRRLFPYKGIPAIPYLSALSNYEEALCFLFWKKLISSWK